MTEAEALADQMDRAVDADLWFGQNGHIDGRCNLTLRERNMIVAALRALKPAPEEKRVLATEKGLTPLGDAVHLLQRAYQEMQRWKSCQSIGACRQCVDDGVLLALKTYFDSYQPQVDEPK